MVVDEQRLNAFLGKAVGDLGAAVSAALVSIGDELGFYKALAAEPLTPRRTGAQDGRLRDVLVSQGGLTRFRRATETPYNMVLEARP